MRLFIGSWRIPLLSGWTYTIIFLLPLLDILGNHPVWLAKVVAFFSSSAENTLMNTSHLFGAWVGLLGCRFLLSARWWVLWFLWSVVCSALFAHVPSLSLWSQGGAWQRLWRWVPAMMQTACFYCCYLYWFCWKSCHRVQVPDQFWLPLQFVDVVGGFGGWQVVRYNSGWWFACKDCIGIVFEDDRYKWYVV